MAMSTNPTYPCSVNNGVVAIAPADTTTLKTLITAGTNGTRVDSITITSTDTAAMVVKLWVTYSAVDYCIGSVPVAIAAGTNGSTVGVNGLNTTYIPGINSNRSLMLKSGEVLKVSVVTTVTADKVIHVRAEGGDY